MEKRYQVFVSSTFEDLKEERAEVVQALLELDCIPCGMEYFPASSDAQWDFIKRLIDDCDYYVVIIAGMYGSMDSEGISYTQKEYEYAISIGIPAIGFLHSNPENIKSSKTEKDPKKNKKLNDFKSKVKERLCKYWDSAKDLGGVVSRSMIQEIKRNPRIGWIKANTIDSNAEKTILSLYKKIEQLESEIKINSQKEFDYSKFYKDTDQLEQGDDKIEITITVTFGDWQNKKKGVDKITTTWNKITYLFFPKIVNGIRDSSFKYILSRSLSELTLESKKFKDKENVSFTISDDSFQTIKIQLMSLGYIETTAIMEENIKMPIKKIKLTELGEQILLKQRALKRVKSKQDII